MKAGILMLLATIALAVGVFADTYDYYNSSERVTEVDGERRIDIKVACWTCDGSGQVMLMKCRKCDGIGWLWSGSTWRDEK